MTETSMNEPGTQEPVILMRLSDLEDQEDFLSHFPDVRGRAVVNPLGEEVGVVEDLYVNPRDRQVEMAAIEFTGPVGQGGKKVLVPVEEIQILNGEVRILSSEERIRLAPEYHEGAPMYEPYYEYWSARQAETDTPPEGRLELEGEDMEEEEEIPAR